MFRDQNNFNTKDILLSFEKMTVKVFFILFLTLFTISGFSSSLTYGFPSSSANLNRELHRIISNKSDETSFLKQNSNSGIKNQTTNSGYFPLAYSGNGVDHMNINLVALDKTGIEIGDEIGVFDGDLCAGAAIIEDKHIKENSISIPASANDRTEYKPNGYTPGHKITLKLYRKDIVYILYFVTVNNSRDIFEKNESMFALIDFSKSTSTSLFLNQKEINLYPNPFNHSIKIEIYLSQPQKLVCEIFDINGNNIRTFIPDYAEANNRLIEFTWDGKNNDGQRVAYGIYFCRTNQTITKIIFNPSVNSN